MSYYTVYMSTFAKETCTNFDAPARTSSEGERLLPKSPSLIVRVLVIGSPVIRNAIGGPV